MGSSTDEQNHALVFGASGISGWAIVNQILNDYPAKGVFSAVTALTNRPLPVEYALWSKDPRLDVVSGLDLMKGSQEELEASMEQKIKGIEHVTQVYFFAYKFEANPDDECSVNKIMLERAIRAVEKLSAKLSYVVLPSGTKYYGVHLLADGFPFKDQLPLHDDLPRIPEPEASKVFYYHQYDALKALGEGKNWTWCEVRPDVVVGYVPNNNTYCLAQTLAIYLSLYASLHPPKSECPFPGTPASYRILSNDSSQDIVARFSIHASLHPAKTSHRSFNVADSATPSSWSKRWPAICAWFGLEGVGPADADSTADGVQQVQPGAYLDAHRAEWKELATRHGLRSGVMDVELGEGKGGYQYFIMTLFDFDRHVDLGGMREVGFEESVEGDKSWAVAFERFRKGKAIP